MRVVEFTGGSTGSSLGMVCAAKGYPFVVLSSDAFAKEKLLTMTAFGADLRMVPSDGGTVTPALFERFRAAIKTLADEPDTFWTDQFHNTDALDGYAGIGRELLALARPFGWRMLVADPYVDAAAMRALGAERVSLEQLLRDSDFVVATVLLNTETRHLMNAERFAQMKRSAYFINLSRGPIVDEPALIAALRSGTIAGAGIDVFEKEPTDPDNPLFKLDNVVLSPHTAGTTWDTWFRRADFAYQNIQRVWKGEKPQAVATDYDEL